MVETRIHSTGGHPAFPWFQGVVKLKKGTRPQHPCPLPSTLTMHQLNLFDPHQSPTTGVPFHSYSPRESDGSEFLLYFTFLYYHVLLHYACLAHELPPHMGCPFLSGHYASSPLKKGTPKQLKVLFPSPPLNGSHYFLQSLLHCILFPRLPSQITSFPHDISVLRDTHLPFTLGRKLLQ